MLTSLNAILFLVSLTRTADLGVAKLSPENRENGVIINTVGTLPLTGFVDPH
jgi:hypothetical protein